MNKDKYYINDSERVKMIRKRIFEELTPIEKRTSCKIYDEFTENIKKICHGHRPQFLASGLLDVMLDIATQVCADMEADEEIKDFVDGTIEDISRAFFAWERSMLTKRS